MLNLPIFDEFDFDVEPIAPDWKGPIAHVGPLETVTPLVEKLSGKTTFATIAMMAGVISWGERRLRSFTQTDFIAELAEASFAWHFDWRYVDTTAEPCFSPPEQPPAFAASFTIDEFLRDSMFRKGLWYSFYQPIMSLFHMANVVRFILPEPIKDPFEEWLVAVSDRLDDIAAAPDLDVPNIDDFETTEDYDEYCAPRRGVPLPPMVLDPSVDLSSVDLSAAAISHLTSLNLSQNRFLRSPEALRELGFEGVPYGRDE